MSWYVVLVFGPQQAPINVEAIECGSDEDAVEIAALHARTCGADAYEVWARGRKIVTSRGACPVPDRHAPHARVLKNVRS